jgi:hypothetical protein
MTVTNQNLIQDEIERRMNSCYACHYSVQNIFPCHVLSINVKIGIFEDYNFAYGFSMGANLVYDIKGATD